MKNKKNVSLVALIILSGCAELRKFPQEFKRDFIGDYRSCTNYNFTYYNARTKN
jgi:hypothetical protein